MILVSFTNFTFVTEPSPEPETNVKFTTLT